MSDHLSTPEDEVKQFTSRYRLFYGFILLSGFIFFSRLWYLQIFKGEKFRYYSEKNLLKESEIYAPRGKIFDREGRILVDNLPGFEATITPQYALHLEDTAKEVSKVVHLPEQRIVQMVKTGAVKNGKFLPVRIKENLSRDEVARLERLQLDHPGLNINMFIKRTYPLHENAAQLVGYVREISKAELPKLNKNKPKGDRFRQGDIIGKRGLEFKYDDTLRGKDGLKFKQVDAFGRETTINTEGIFKAFLNTQEAISGKNLVLTIDKDLQEAAYHSFMDKDRIGAAVALDAKNGEVLAWVNSPSYDPNNFTTRISPKLWKKLSNDPFKPMLNKVIQTHHPPGSTFKAVVALAALEEGIITQNTTHTCLGKIVMGRRPFHCHIKHGHGAVNVVTALERSCNIFFYKVANQLGIDKIAKYAHALGIGLKTGVDLTGEKKGLMPTSDWKKQRFGEVWQPGENYTNGIGQGYIVTTPLQLAVSFSSIANKGPAFRPHLVKKVLDHNENVLEEKVPEVLLNPNQDIQENGKPLISKKNYAIVQKGLFDVANGERGTAKWWKIPNVPFAGKTGTAQFFSMNSDQVYSKCEEKPIQQRHHGWFVGYAPANDPKIVVSVFAEHGCHGSTGAVPIARDIMKAYIEKYYPELLKKNKLTDFKVVPVESEV